MNMADNNPVSDVTAKPQHSLKSQSTISTKLFLALGFITITAIVAGIASILALNRFQNNFDSLINREIPTLEDTSNISQLSVTMASLGASLIISPTTWSRENLMGQVDDDAQWLEEILTRITNENLSGNRKQELLNLKELLLDTYATLNTLTENRITYAKQLEDIDRTVLQLQQDMVSVQFSTNLPDGTFITSGPLQQWNQSIHAIIFSLIAARTIRHPAPLDQLGWKVNKALGEIEQQMTYLPAEAKLDAADIYDTLRSVAEGDGSLFAVKKADFLAMDQIDATMRTARTIAESFMSASELASRDIRKSINTTNQVSSGSMDMILQAMVGFILISAFLAVATFFYVSRTVLHRLVNLRRSMVAHAEGAATSIDTTGEDEITDMARSLQYLVDTLHQREMGLTQAKEEAEHASVAKTRFLAAASHDLRQPLQALNLFVYALEGKEKDEEKRDIITLIRNSLDSLKELLNTLLDISKLEAGVVQPNMRDFSAGTMIERIKGELTAVAWANDLELRTVPSSAIVRCDPSLLETVVRNLVDNAIKYTEHGRVLVGCRRRNAYVRFEVWDTGPGIPADQRELIFQDFYQIDNAARKRSQGLGLGLSIVKRMSNLMGCAMGCDSQPGKGSVFWVEAPISLEGSIITHTVTPRLIHAAPSTGKGHIVLIEDDDQVLLGLQSLLETQGFTTLAFQEANRDTLTETFAVKKRMPDLIIADYRLEAQTTGSEAIHSIREILNKNIPAIIITGDTAPERLREAKKSGFPILHKPVRPEELIATVHEILLNAQSEKPMPPKETQATS